MGFDKDDVILVQSTSESGREGNSEKKHSEVVGYWRGMNMGKVVGIFPADLVNSENSRDPLRESVATSQEMEDESLENSPKIDIRKISFSSDGKCK